MRKRPGRLRVCPLSVAAFLSLLLCGQVSEGAALLFAVLFHECGHLLVVRALKIPLCGFSFDLFGARLSVGRLLSYGEEWLLAAAGPLFSFLAAAAGALLWRRAPFFFAFSAASFLLGVFNLLPIRSFDGGRMLDATLSCFLAPEESRRVLTVTSFLSLLFLFGAAVYLLLRRGVGASLFFASTGLLFRFLESEKNEIY